ncbi:MAG TPA: DinB family protein [Pyrinomonadaceae bacterium]|nr:DinB family protein [Pyrinomonadaceae bacterium]
MSLEEMLDVWKEVRAGLIAELEQIPPDQFAFQATPQSRSVAGLIHHILETQRFLVSELCRPDTDFKRLPKEQVRESIERQAATAQSGENKEELITSLRSQMDWAEATLRAFGEDALGEKAVPRRDGKTMSKLGYLCFIISHENYHRGQIALYERMMQIEPVLTAKFRRIQAGD